MPEAAAAPEGGPWGSAEGGRAFQLGGFTHSGTYFVPVPGGQGSHPGAPGS